LSRIRGRRLSLSGNAENSPYRYVRPTVFEKAFRWLGENFAAGIVGAFAALAVSAMIAFVVADKSSDADQVTAAAKEPREQHRFTLSDSWPDEVNAWTVVLASE